MEQLRAGDWQVHCPICGAVTKSAPTPENAPVGGETVYGLTKVDQEKLVLLWGKQIGIPTVALRYSCTYGPRQSIFNPYTGVIAIFCTRLLNNLPPVLYEDGEQTRDFSFVEDIARANLLAAETDKLEDCRSTSAAVAEFLSVKSREQISDALEDRHRAGSERRISSGRNAPSHERHDADSRRRATSHGSILPQASAVTSIGSAPRADVRDYFGEAAKVLARQRDRASSAEVAAR